MSTKTTLIAPSILSADFGNFRQGVRDIEQSGADWIHVDVMDNHFVPNLTFGPQVVAALRGDTSLPMDVHLMTERPDSLFQACADAGADHVTFHIEAAVHAHRMIYAVKDLGMKAGISIVPSSPVTLIETILEDVDIVLVMTVNPGFGGQSLVPATLEKTQQLKQLRAERGLDYHIVVDGGVSAATAGRFRDAGADVLVTGSAFFAEVNKSSFVEGLRNA